MNMKRSLSVLVCLVMVLALVEPGHSVSALDGFTTDPSTPVFPIIMQADGKILAGATTRLNSDGSRDSSFNPSVDPGWYNAAVQADGKILIGGPFTAVNGLPKSNMARLNPDGSLDSGFNFDGNGAVALMTVQPDGKILISGYFTAIGGIPKDHFARINSDGSLDQTFSPPSSSWPSTVTIQPGWQNPYWRPVYCNWRGHKKLHRPPEPGWLS